MNLQIRILALLSHGVKTMSGVLSTLAPASKRDITQAVRSLSIAGDIRVTHARNGVSSLSLLPRGVRRLSAHRSVLPQEMETNPRSSHDMQSAAIVSVYRVLEGASRPLTISDCRERMGRSVARYCVATALQALRRAGIAKASYPPEIAQMWQYCLDESAFEAAPPRPSSLPRQGVEAAMLAVLEKSGSWHVRATLEDWLRQETGYAQRTILRGISLLYGRGDLRVRIANCGTAFVRAVNCPGCAISPPFSEEARERALQAYPVLLSLPGVGA